MMEGKRYEKKNNTFNPRFSSSVTNRCTTSWEGVEMEERM